MIYLNLTFHELIRMIHSLVAIGLCKSESRLTGMPGWRRGSWGYHGDDGKIFAEGTGGNYGPLYGTGDVVGCGIDLQSGIIFFTKNGEHLGKRSDSLIQQSSRLTPQQEQLSPKSRVDFSLSSGLAIKMFESLSILVRMISCTSPEGY
jgi:SPRY domain